MVFSASNPERIEHRRHKKIIITHFICRRRIIQEGVVVCKQKSMCPLLRPKQDFVFKNIFGVEIYEPVLVS
ncbi:MAG: hypothetical protein LBF72_03200, partial [Holosporales bacterium]|nr:hypothetical protein [Holosporales bacterium]